jgi:glutaconate CoA-transferase subunit A
MGIPFIPVRGILGSDYLSIQPRFKVMKCPFSGHEVVLVEAIVPDYTVIHAFKADSKGNVLIDKHSDVDLAVQAANVAIATVEEIVGEGDLVPDKKSRLMSWMNFHAIVHAPFGAHPAGCPSYYGLDRDHLKEYVKLAGNKKHFKSYLKKYVYDFSDHNEYVKLVKEEGWNSSPAACRRQIM